MKKYTIAAVSLLLNMPQTETRYAVGLVKCGRVGRSALALQVVERLLALNINPKWVDRDLSVCAYGECENVFLPRRKDNRYCSRRCAALARDRTLKIVPEGIESRVCHACKRPTTDYRCPTCLELWRHQNEIKSDDLEGYGYA